MFWFKKDKVDSKINSPKDMSPLEAVTHLCASIQISDGQVDYEEKKSWLESIKILFPKFSHDRANRFLNEAFNNLGEKDKSEKITYINQIIDRIRVLLNEEQLEVLGNCLRSLIESDGIVMTSEIEIAKMIESKLNIRLNIDLN